MGKNKTIYFRTKIIEKLNTIPEPGPLINDLLEAHFNSSPRPTTTQVIDTRERGRVAGLDDNGEITSMVGDMDSIVAGDSPDASSKDLGEALADTAQAGKVGADKRAKKITADGSDVAIIENEKPCCSKKSRCQHWDWDSDNGQWVNTLSGRKVAND